MEVPSSEEESEPEDAPLDDDEEEEVRSQEGGSLKGERVWFGRAAGLAVWLLRKSAPQDAGHQGCCSGG